MTRKFVFLLLFTNAAYAAQYQECQVFKDRSDIKSDRLTTVTGYADRANHFVKVIIYNVYDVLGEKVIKSGSDGFFKVDIYTKERPSLRPNIRVFCLTRN